jgi:hypothetical protein
LPRKGFMITAMGPYDRTSKMLGTVYAASKMLGTVYAASSPVAVTGQGGATIGSQFISDTLTVTRAGRSRLTGLGNRVPLADVFSDLRNEEVLAPLPGNQLGHSRRARSLAGASSDRSHRAAPVDFAMPGAKEVVAK